MDSKIIEYAKTKNIIITENALRCLNISNYKKIINKLCENKKVFVNMDDVKQIINEEITEDDYCLDKDFQILEEYDVTNKNLSQGKVEDFLNLFLDKYDVLSKIIKQRDGISYIPIEDARKLSKNKEVDIIGMVLNKRLTKNENLFFTVDDPTGKINVIVTQNDEKLFSEAKEVLLDNVVGFRCVVIGKDVLIAREIIFPDMKVENNKRTSKLKNDKYLVVLGDLHLGSKLFLEKEFNDFIDWINKKNNEDLEIVNKIKYIVVAGDVVDGIGIYPAQFDELSEPDIFKQYKLFEDYMLMIPKDIEIFIIPGNHDAVRRSDPQPALPESLIPRLYKEKNIHLLGSPSWVVFDGLKTLIYHGYSLHGIYATINSAKMDKPDTAMKEILKRRDIMPSYGNRQIFAPIEKNFLVIKEEPDIYIGADVHHHAYSKYKGCHLLCTSTWQSTTKFQISVGHTPTVCKVLLFNLKTEKVLIKDFEKEDHA